MQRRPDADARGTAAPVRSPAKSARETTVVMLCLVAAAILYGTLIFFGRGGAFPPVMHGLTFNSMLTHMLDGRFDVDPQAIGDEGLVRDGAIIAYFGILPALLRLPLLLAWRFPVTDFTALSCLAAVSLMALFKLLSLLTVWRSNDTSQSYRLMLLFGAAILLSGPQIDFLVPRIYQEVCLWADVCAAAFVYLVLRGYYSEQGFTRKLLAWAAFAAGLCLLDRVSTALGLYTAFGLLWILLAWGRIRSKSWNSLFPLLAPALILVAFVAAAGFVNYERWGNVFQFADWHRQLLELQNPDRLLRLRDYGEFNPVRIGFGLSYYFFPIWVLHGGDGHLLWTAFQERAIDFAELPPSSFLVSDPLLVGLTLYSLVHLIKYKDTPRPAVVVTVLVGLLVPSLLILCAISMAFRYRVEFYPLMEFGAFIGFGQLLSSASRSRTSLLTVGTYFGIFISLFLYLLYRASSPGSAIFYLNQTDIVSYYRAAAPVMTLFLPAAALCGVVSGILIAMRRMRQIKAIFVGLIETAGWWRSLDDGSPP